MNDNDEMPSIFDKHRTTDDVPLLTCGLKYDKHNYEEKVNDCSTPPALTLNE
jgi:hypothetical protein